MSEYKLAADHYEPWSGWDLWSDELPDGEYDVYPPRESGIEGEPGQVTARRFETERVVEEGRLRTHRRHS